MSGTHRIADPDAPAYDTCSYCGQAIVLRDGQLVTMLTNNAECYAASQPEDCGCGGADHDECALANSYTVNLGTFGGQS